MERSPLVGVVSDASCDAGGDASLTALCSDVALQCQALLDRFGVPYERRVLSALHDPDGMRAYAEAAWGRGICDVITLAPTGHLAGMLKAFGHRLSVIAVPLARDNLEAMTALLSVVQMPRSAPVSVVGVNNGTNAALLAVGALARTMPHLWDLLDAYHEEAARAVREARLPAGD